MTELLTGYDVTNVPNSAVIKNLLYITNDFDQIKKWDGLGSSMNDAGINAPTAAIGAPSQVSGSNCTNGIHLIRYRYKDSTSPDGEYRSNPSDSLSITVTSTQKQRLTVGASATDIIYSTDAKVDTIVIEMTEVDGTTYYIVEEIANDTVTQYDIDVSDTTLITGTATATHDDFGHEPPPLSLCIAECRGFTFVGGHTSATIGTVTTNGTTTVTGTSFPTNIDGRFIRFDSESEVYTIFTRDSATSLTLDRAYTGANGTHTSLVVSKTPSRIYWSRSGSPESFKQLERARDMLQGKNDTLVGMTDYIGDLWVFGRYSMERLVFVSNPATGERIDVAGSYGLWNQRCLIRIEGQLFGWGTNGVWVINGARPQWVSERIDTTVKDNIDYSYSDKFHGEYDPQTKIMRWWYVASGDTQCKRSITYDLERNQFSLDTYRNEINSSCIGPDSTNNIHMYVCDDGYTWDHEGVTDGVPNTTDRKYTVASGTSTTITVSETINGTTAQWAGVTIYNATQDISTILTGISSSTVFTCSTWNAPVFGDIMYVGSIPLKITTPWFVSDGEKKLRPKYLHVHFSPSDTGTVRVRYYTEFSTTAEVMDVGADYDPPDGVTIVDGTNYLDVDIDGGSGDGFVAVPIVASWERAIQAEIECFDNRGTLRILDVIFDMPRMIPQVDGE